jgi:hypothetical protein
MCRFKIDDTIESVINRVSDKLGCITRLEKIGTTAWHSAWLSSKNGLKGRSIESSDQSGEKRYPLLIRSIKLNKKLNESKVGFLDSIEQEEKRFLILSLDADTVDSIFEIAGIAGQIIAPRISVDTLVRDLVIPPILEDNLTQNKKEINRGRSYLIGAVWAAIEGHGRSLRSCSFFGDDLAEAKMFRDIMDKLSVTRVGLRDHKTDKEILSISSIGDITLQAYRGPEHLNAIDELTFYLKSHSYINWRET